MTDKDYRKLCSETPLGTPLSFFTGEAEVRGKFVGCSDDSVLIEANGKTFIWPRDLIDYRKSDYPIPSYS